MLGPYKYIKLNQEGMILGVLYVLRGAYLCRKDRCEGLLDVSYPLWLF